MKQSIIIDNFIDSISEIISRRPFGLKYTKHYEHHPIYFEELQDNIFAIDPKVKIRYGMSKFVIISSKLNQVIKIPFCGIYDYCYGDVKNASYEDENEDLYVYNAFTSNYCEEEYEKYCDLWELNLNCFVAKTKVYKKNNIEVFLQEKILPNDDCSISRIPSQESHQIVRKWMKEDRACINNNWLANCIDTYGKAKTERFLDYCNNEDPEIIDDLHDGNLGYRFNGTPAILDYTGFYD